MNDYERIAKIIRHIDTAFLRQPSLEELAQVVDLSPSHFHRMFVKWAGITPKDFIQTLTMDHAKRLLKHGSSVLDSSLDSGLSGPGRLHDLCVSMEAATPGEIKSGGAGMKIGWGVAESPFGKIFVAMTPKGLCHLSFFNETHAEALSVFNNDWPKAESFRDDRMVENLSAKIFKTDSPEKLSPLRIHVKGTAFQVKVWKALLEIPEATLTTYGRIAEEIGSPKASRAVGTAIGSNQVSYLIPCHRVIRESGVSGGYRWGQLRKRVMISWEAARIGKS